jgi:hypothetical protein
MKAKEFTTGTKPRNFVAKNAIQSGAGAHKDKKKAEKQGDIKHKKEKIPMESAPDGWEGTVKAMKKHKEIDNPYALAWSMKNKGYKSHKKEDASSRMSMAQELYKSNPDLDSEDDILNAGFAIMKQRDGGKAARYYFSYDEDFPSDFISEYKWLQRHEHDVGEATGRDAYQRDYDSSVSGMDRRGRENDEGNTEPPNNFAVYINGKKWKVFAGRGTYADDYREKAHYQQLKTWADKKSAATGKKWTVSPTGEPATA